MATRFPAFAATATRPPSRARRALSVVILATVGLATPAGATSTESAEGANTTTTTTTAAPSAGAEGDPADLTEGGEDSGGATSTSAPPVEAAPTPTPTPGADVSEGPATDGSQMDGSQQDGGPQDDGLQVGDELPGDPLAQEAPGDDAPAGQVEVPPPTGYADQDDFGRSEILWSSVAAAETKLAEITDARTEVVAEARILRVRAKELTIEQGALAGESRAALADLVAATDRLRARSIAGFQYHSSGGRGGPGPATGDYGAIVEHQRRTRFIDTGLRVDEAGIDRLSQLRSLLDRNAVELLERSQAIESALAEVEATAARLALEREQAQIEFEAFRAGSEIFVHGVVFPIAGDFGVLVDSYGFPRMTGTDDEHWHEGIDIFAERGTPLVATERGVITRVGVGRLGGLKFWLVGESGTEWYYAHLDSFAPDLTEGLVVEPGRLLGYVGNTGNAIGTPPHLHMELHPGGFRPVNPYPLLKVVADRDRARIEAGGQPLAAHEPVVVQRADEPPPDPAAPTPAGAGG